MNVPSGPVDGTEVDVDHEILGDFFKCPTQRRMIGSRRERDERRRAKKPISRHWSTLGAGDEIFDVGAVGREDGGHLPHNSRTILANQLKPRPHHTKLARETDHSGFARRYRNTQSTSRAGT